MIGLNIKNKLNKNKEIKEEVNVNVVKEVVKEEIKEDIKEVKKDIKVGSDLPKVNKLSFKYGLLIENDDSFKDMIYNTYEDAEKDLISLGYNKVGDLVYECEFGKATIVVQGFK